VTDHSVRNLAYLEGSASTARVLNLRRIHKRLWADPEYSENPLFQHPILNRSIILKHRLRGHERDLFIDRRQTATKVIVPMDQGDLKLGGRYVFVGQINYDAIMGGVFGDTWRADSLDRELLGVIDQLPSLDPFLLREQLRRYGRNPASCYFDISEADLARMYKFVENEVRKLIDLCFSGSSDRAVLASRLVEKVLANAVDAETEPLRLTLRLERGEYREGVFCWKGFLYYKWTLAEALPRLGAVTEAIANARGRPPVDAGTNALLEKTRQGLRESVIATLESARKSLTFYDGAFASLVEGKPNAFRDFLLSAPARFCELGERLGAVSHILSYWSFRFPQSRMPTVSGQELVDIFSDFESSLAFGDPEPAGHVAYATIG
jgi:hypothetical protein